MRTFTRVSDGQMLRGQKLLGTGGQGEVWRAELDGRSVAVKIYHQQSATPPQRAAIERLVDKGPPAKYFLWPSALVEDRATGSFGYIMELREPRFRALEDFMTRRVEPTFRALLTASWQLADGFLRLHSQGFCYRDISFGNVFFDPTSGDIQICDNDNVDISGTEVGGILGTPRFMAPEVVRLEAVPSDQTDRFSLAVLLFHLTMGGHPLDGELEAKIHCMDGPGLARVYGFKPLYIFDPSDPSNRPRPGLHNNPIVFHPLYPAQLRDLFLRAFTDGMHYPAKRVRESEWRKAFARAVDSILLCACTCENFYDGEALRAQGPGQCWSCRRPLTLPPRIRIESDVVMLTAATKLYGYHLGAAQDDVTPVAELAQNPANPAMLGLRNLTSEAWTLTRPDGSLVDVAPGRSAPIVAGNKINFGSATGEIRT